MITSIIAAPAPPADLSMSTTAGWAFNIVMAIAVVVTIVCLGRQSHVERTWTWILAVPAFGLNFFIEPLIDILGLTWYATNAPLMLEIMGRQTPWYILLIYCSYLPLGFWTCYLYMRRGPVSRNMMLALWASGVVAVLAFERLIMIGNNFSRYYGDNPAFVLDYPLYSMIQNGALPIVGAAFLMWAKENLTGWRVLWLFPLAPGGFAAYLVIQTWPSYVALNSDWSYPIQIVAAVLSVGINLAICGAILFSPWLRDLCTRAATATDRNTIANVSQAKHGLATTAN